jgi:adenylate cyclase
LSKVSALLITARNTAFTFKGKNVDVTQIARQLKVSHLLEGSVRKSGGRVRITAQLIDCATGGHVWAERYDRDLNDIFALQDDISESIVSALKLRLLPEEKKAIENRGTSDPEAYKLYLMARHYSVVGNFGVARRSEGIIRLCRRAIEIDPNYAQPWALMASAQVNLRFFAGGADDGWEAAEKAIALDPNAGEAHAAKARLLVYHHKQPEALREIEQALRLEPDSYEVNLSAGYVLIALRRYAESAVRFERATSLMENEFSAAGMVISAYVALDNEEAQIAAAKRCVVRTENILSSEPDNGSAMGFLISALAVLKEGERAKAWVERALLLDPENYNMRYNVACSFATNLKDPDAALDLLGPYLEYAGVERLNWVKNDVDLDSLRDSPRFKAMIAEADARLGQSSG